MSELLDRKDRLIRGLNARKATGLEGATWLPLVNQSLLLRYRETLPQ
jgi:hypothetical protein